MLGVSSLLFLITGLHCDDALWLFRNTSFCQPRSHRAERLIACTLGFEQGRLAPSRNGSTRHEAKRPSGQLRFVISEAEAAQKCFGACCRCQDCATAALGFGSASLSSPDHSRPQK